MFLSLTLLLNNSTQNFLYGVDLGFFFLPIFNVAGIKAFPCQCRRGRMGGPCPVSPLSIQGTSIVIAGLLMRGENDAFDSVFSED